MDRVTELLAANSRLVLKGRDLKRQLEVVRDQFLLYAKEHRLKEKRFLDAAEHNSAASRESNLHDAKVTAFKAETNENIAKEIQATLDSYHVVDVESNLSAS